jgi:hypothetical protein
MTYNRVQMLLEPEQQQTLNQIAQRQGKSVAEVTRQVINLGLKELNAQNEFEQRASALQRARQLRKRIVQQQVEIPNLSAVLDDLRQERTDELSAEFIHRD